MATIQRRPGARAVWYGVRGFFKWCESKLYKMHIRVFLSRYRAYTTCGTCGGGRLQPEALNFRIEGRHAARLVATAGEPAGGGGGRHWPAATSTRRRKCCAAEIETRLRYLDRVGLGYLTLDRAARTLSGGEVAAGEPDELPGREPGQHALRDGRTERRPAPARCRPA